MAKRKEKVDAVIVGAGAAGCHAAMRLAEAGKSVVVLEAGPAWTLGDLVSSQIYARRLRWGGAPITKSGDNAFDFTFNAGWGFGGASIHHYGTWPRMKPADFKTASLYGKGLDWPLEYDTLRPYYDRVQAQVGLSGDTDAEIWRPQGAAYALPPMPVFSQGDLIAKGFAETGRAVSAPPLAIATDWFKGRPPCIWDGWCDAGCPIGALFNPLVTHKPAAAAAGAEFRAHATVTRVLHDMAARMRGLLYTDADGESWEQPADRVFLAGSVVGNARLLLASASEHHPNGVGNAHDLVGRYFMTQALQPVFALFDAETQVSLGLPSSQLMSHADYVKDGPLQAEAGGFGSVQWQIGQALKPNDLIGISISRADLYGAKLAAFMERAARNLAQMQGFVEGLPHAENRITLGKQADRHGVPIAHIHHGFDADARAVIAAVRAQGVAIMQAAGADEAWAAPRPATAHMFGGTVMGEDPDAAVTDSYGRVHGTENLYVLGSGLFPTAGGVNPTFTIYALTERSIDANLSEM